MNYSNTYPMDTIYVPETSVPFVYNPSYSPATSVPFEYSPATSVHYEYQETSVPISFSNLEYSDLSESDTVDPPKNNDTEHMLKAIRLFGIEFTENQLNNAREMKEKLKHDTTISEDVRVKRFDKINDKIRNFEEELDFLKSMEKIVSYLQRKLKDSKENKESLEHDATISEGVRVKRLDAVNEKISKLQERLECLVYESKDGNECSIS